MNSKNRNGNEIYILSRIEPLPERHVVEDSLHVNSNSSIELVSFKIPCDTKTPTPVNFLSAPEIYLSHAVKMDDSDDSDAFDTFELNIMKEQEIPINSIDNLIHKSTNPIKSKDNSGEYKGNRKEVVEISEQVNRKVPIDEKPVSRAIEINREQPSKHAVHKQLPIQGKGNSTVHGCIGKLSYLWSIIILWYSSLPIAIRIIFTIVITLLLLYITITLLLLLILGIRTSIDGGHIVIYNSIEYHYLYWIRKLLVKTLAFENSICILCESGFKLKRMYSLFIYHN